MISSCIDPRPSPTVRVSTVRKLGPSAKVFLQQALQSINWSPLYRLQNPDDMVSYFYSVVYQLLDRHAPARTVLQHSRDKPWVNEHFRYLIRRRQFAWRNGRMDEYRVYRNKVQRAAWRLRRKYCQNRLNNLHRTDCRRWWQEIKGLTGQVSSTRDELSGLAHQLTNGDDG